MRATDHHWKPSTYACTCGTMAGKDCHRWLGPANRMCDMFDSVDRAAHVDHHSLNTGPAKRKCLGTSGPRPDFLRAWAAISFCLPEHLGNLASNDKSSEINRFGPRNIQAWEVCSDHHRRRLEPVLRPPQTR